MTEPWLIDLAQARDVGMTDPSASTTLSELEWWWFHCVPYLYEGPNHRIVCVQEVRRRKYGACGDAAAHLLAAAMRQGIRAQLCVEEPASKPDYRHVRVYLPGENVTLDPYASLRPKIPATCERLIDL